MPKVHHAHYAGGVGDRDVFVLENLLEAEYYNFENEKCLNEEHMKVTGRNDADSGNEMSQSGSAVDSNPKMDLNQEFKL